jgi:hypothetical protein
MMNSMATVTPTKLDLSLLPGRKARDVLVMAPENLDGHIKITVPEFYGTLGKSPFAIDQILHWEDTGEGKQCEFTLDTPAAEVGIDYHGTLSLREPNVLDFEAYVCNVMQLPIEEGHHTVHLDFSTCSALEDLDGSRTFFFTNDGWVSLSTLVEGLEEFPKTIWVGATYNDFTVIWRTIARVSRDGSLVVAFAMDKGYALASNHPEWPKGLLAGYRWATIPTEQERVSRGRLYFCTNGLDELREHYARDYRP